MTGANESKKVREILDRIELKFEVREYRERLQAEIDLQNMAIQLLRGSFDRRVILESRYYAIPKTN